METPPSLSSGMELPGRIIVAHNYDTASENRVHSDFTAIEHGFAGGLVPGVALYAYLTIPVVQALGKEWLERGRFSARFLRPVYDGNRLKVLATVVTAEPLRIETCLVDDTGAIRAEGVATVPSDDLYPAMETFPLVGLPLPENRRTPTLDDLPAGYQLGSKVFAYNPGHSHDTFLDLLVNPLPVYRGPGGACHPALLVAQTNYLLMQNIDLGPWLHVGSDVSYFASPLAKERLSLRARIGSVYEKKGHLFAVVEAASFGQRDRAIAAITHTVIIRPKKPEQSE